MKRFISLTVIAAMCLSLTGCFSPKNMGINKVTELLEEGRYDEAIQVITVMQAQSELTGGENAEQAMGQEPAQEQEAGKGLSAAYLSGVWKNTQRDDTVEIREDGTVILSTVNYNNEIQTYENELELIPQDDGGVRVSLGNNTYPKYMNMDGVDVLENYGDYYLREEDFDDLLEVVEITEDNWEQYFEIRLASDKDYDKYGDVNSNMMSYGLFLKDEYVDRYYSSEDLAIEFTYVSVTYKIDGTDKSEEIHLGEVEKVSDYPHDLEVQLKDRRLEQDTETDISDYHGTVSDEMGSNIMYHTNDEWSISLPDDFTFSRSTGSLVLADERLVTMMLNQQ